MNRFRLFICLFLAVAVIQSVSASWKGRFEIGGYPTLYDDDFMEDRTPFTSRFKLIYSPSDTSGWTFKTDIKLRSEFNSGDATKLRVRDLYADYAFTAADESSHTLHFTAGLFSPDGVSGTGDVLGGGCRYQFKLNKTSSLVAGVFGGANAVLRDSRTDDDGTRLGGYFLLKDTQWGFASVAFISATDTLLKGDEKEMITFAASLRLMDRLDFYHSGEWTLQAESGEENTLTLYYASMGYDLNDLFRLSLTWDYYDRIPYLQPEPEDTDTSSFYDFDRFESYKGQGISPRLDVQLPSNWRIFGRYRYRETDDFQSRTWHQYAAGFGCSDLAGFAFTASVHISDGDDREYETGFVTISRDLMPGLNLGISLAGDRFSYPETAASAIHDDHTWRAGINSSWRITRDLSLNAEYERVMGDDSSDKEHRLFFNWQYRF